MKGVTGMRTHAMSTFGYAEMLRCIHGELDPGDAVSVIQQQSRQYAKRQLTWVSKGSGHHVDFRHRRGKPGRHLREDRPGVSGTTISGIAVSGSPRTCLPIPPVVIRQK